MKAGDCVTVIADKKEGVIATAIVQGVCIVKLNCGLYDVYHQDELILTPKVKKEECL